MYVTNAASNTVSQYSAGTTGLLAALIPAAWTTGATPVSVAMTKNGKSIYVSNQGSNNVSLFAINTSTHQLTPQPVPAISATVRSPSQLAGAQLRQKSCQSGRPI